MRRPSSKQILIAVAVVVATALVVAGVTLWRASKAARDSAAAEDAAATIPFTSPAPGSHSPVFEEISTPAIFTCTALLEGKLYLASPGVLLEYDSSGVLQRRYRAGRELPPAPITALAAGASSGRSELYIATQGEGLVILSGGNLTQVRPKAASMRDVTSLLPVSTGQLLLGTAKDGVLVYEGQELRPFHASLLHMPITALAGDASSLWVGTLDRGLLHWHAGQLDSFPAGGGFPDQQVLSLAVSGGTVYAGTPAGVAVIENGKQAKILAQGAFASAVAVQGGTLVIGTLSQGLVRLPVATRPPRPALSAQAGSLNHVSQLVPLAGTLYAVAHDGLYSVSASGFTTPVIQPSGAVLAAAHVSALAVDGQDRLWIGYFDQGIDILDSSRSRARHVENDEVFCINAIAPMPDGSRTAVATANGLVYFDSIPAQREVLTRRNGLIADHVTALDVSTGITIAATSAGVTILDGAGARSYNAFHGLVNNHVYAVASRGTTIVAGTLGGLSLIENGQVTRSYTVNNSRLTHNWITALVRSGSDWYAGTYGGAVVRLDGSGQLERFADLPPELIINPNALLATPGAIFAGSLGQGLFKLDLVSRRWTRITAGLPSLNVTALAAGGATLYVGTDAGLVAAPLASL